jgi:hypothetical protein
MAVAGRVTGPDYWTGRLILELKNSARIRNPVTLAGIIRHNGRQPKRPMAREFRLSRLQTTISVSSGCSIRNDCAVDRVHGQLG